MNFVPVSNRAIDFPPGLPVVTTVVRNEMLRLPFWYDYYRQLGFRRFLIVDNGSTDGTQQFLRAQMDTLAVATNESFGQSHFGMDWINGLLHHFCQGRWVLLADADEQLVWPGCERESIAQLLARLEQNGAEGLFTLMIDMYSDRPLGQVGYVAGTPFLASAPFFDRGPYGTLASGVFPPVQYYGGIRVRLFVEHRITVPAPTMSKLPLLRWGAEHHFQNVAHVTYPPVKLAEMRGALLHFKFFDDIVEKCVREVERGEHFSGAREYRALGSILQANPGKSFVDPAASVRYQDSQQLVALDLMSTSRPY